jgi:DDE family transposase
MAADQGDSYRHVRRRPKRHGIRGVIPTRKDQPCDLAFEKAQYRRRNIVERAVGWYKECRRLGTRYEKLAVNDEAFWLVAMMKRDLRLFGFSDRAEPRNFAASSAGHWRPAAASRTAPVMPSRRAYRRYSIDSEQAVPRRLRAGDVRLLGFPEGQQADEPES